MVFVGIFKIRAFFPILDFCAVFYEKRRNKHIREIRSFRTIDNMSILYTIADYPYLLLNKKNKGLSENTNKSPIYNKYMTPDYLGDYTESFK